MDYWNSIQIYVWESSVNIVSKVHGTKILEVAQGKPYSVRGGPLEIWLC